MSRKLNINGVERVVEKGITISNGYIQVRIFNAGQTIREHIGHVSEHDILGKATTRLHDLRDAIRSGKLGQEQKAERWTIKQAADFYWNEEGSKKKSQDSINIFIVRIKEYAGHRWVDEVNYRDVMEFRDWLKKEKGLTDLNINRHHTYLTRLFNILKEWRRTKKIKNIKLPDENPGACVKRPKERWRTRVLTVEDFNRLISVASPRLQRILIVGIHTLLRCKDMEALSISQNVNWSQNHLEGLQAKVGNDYVIPIEEQVMGIITSTEEGVDRILDFTNFRKEFRKAQTDSGITKLKMTDIRRTGARWMVKKGIDIATVSRYLGHTSIEMTQRYVGADTTDLRRGAVVLGELFRMPIKPVVEIPLAVGQ